MQGMHICCELMLICKLSDEMQESARTHAVSMRDREGCGRRLNL